MPGSQCEARAPAPILPTVPPALMPTLPLAAAPATSMRGGSIMAALAVDHLQKKEGVKCVTHMCEAADGL